MTIRNPRREPFSPFADRQQTALRDSILYFISVVVFLVPLWWNRRRPDTA